MKANKGFISMAVIIILIVGVGVYLYINTSNSGDIISDNVENTQTKDVNVTGGDSLQGSNNNESVNSQGQGATHVPNGDNGQNDTVEPRINIVSPTGGEVWNKNNEYAVSWSYEGLNPDDILNIGFRSSDPNMNMCWLDSVNVGLESFKVIPKNIVCGDSSFPDGDYKFQVVVDKYSGGKGVADISNEYFTIN